MSKMELADTISANEVLSLGNRTYKVKSQSDPGQRTGYQVTMDNGNGMPSCGCHAWMWTLLPCKHIFAVIQHTEFSWEDLPPEYLSSPYFNIDSHVIGIPVPIPSEALEEEEVENESFDGATHFGDSDGDDASQLIDLPSAKRGPKSLKALAVQCREKLSLLQNATYLCQSEDAFIVLDSNLKEALSAFNSSLYRDSGLCTEAEHIKKKKAVKRPVTQKDVESKKIKMEENMKENMKERKKKSKRGKKRLPLKLQKKEPICSERVIIEGHEAVPNTIQEDIAEMVKKMSQNEVDKLIDNARLSSSISTDKVARTGLALLEQLFPSEDSDNSDYDAIIEAIINDAKKLCPGLEEQHTFRFALLLLWTLVKKGKFQLHRNIEKEDEEARNSMAACIEALNSIQSLNPDGKRIIDSQHPRSILKMKDKSTKCIRKKVHFEGEADLNQPLTQMDRNQALDAVKKLWSLRESSNYIIARVSNYNVTDDDFKSLASRNWLTDQVIDAYIAFIVQAEIEKGNHITMYPSQTMTGIMSGTYSVEKCRKKLKGFECEAIVGAVIKHQHWTLVIVEPKKGLIYFYNPLTERRIQIREVQRNWCSYMGARMIAFNEPDTMQWKVETKEHSKQTDSFNCGVYCLLFAERHFSGQSITNITKMDLDNMRIQIATNLMMFEVYLTEHCPTCGFVTRRDVREIHCEKCNREFHKKPHCVGEENMCKDSFICRMCSIKFWGENDRTSSEKISVKKTKDSIREKKSLKRR